VPIQPDDLLPTLERIAERVAEARQYLKFDQVRQEIETLEMQASAPGFWDATEQAQEHMRKINQLKLRVMPWIKLEGEVRDAIELVQMVEGDPTMRAQLIEQAGGFEKELEGLETRALMSDPEDINNTFLHIHAGAGGTESCDWAAMLLRMYTRWADRQGYGLETIDIQDGDEAGIRGATLLVKGDYAFGQLKAEAGVHRLVRISPFDAAKRRHTSFCSVLVWPEIDDAVEVEIREEDLRVDTFRSSGAGGQHVNKTESAIRITHLPTKIVVGCQNERSQHQNRAVAMKMLRARLHQIQVEEREAERAAKAGIKKEIGWGSQIRSYVFQPYQLVKDLRTGWETGNIQAVMDGDVDGLIEAWLRWSAGITKEPQKSGAQ
jgi:peptide chain release factor 2